MYGVRVCPNFTDLHAAIQLSQHHLPKRLSFLHGIFLPLLLKIDHKCVFISRLSILYIDLYVFLCQYHTVLITVKFVVLSEVRIMPSASFFFLRIAFVVLHKF